MEAIVDSIYINRSFGDFSVLGDCGDPRLELNMQKPWGEGRADHHGISLDPWQALRMANLLVRPEQKLSLRFKTGLALGEERKHKCLHRNGVHRAGWSVVEGRNKTSHLSLYTTRSDKARGTLDMYPWRTVVLPARTAREVAGLLLLFTGSKLVGTRRVVTSSSELILNVMDKRED